MKYDYYQEHLEWEILDENQEISYLDFETSIYNLNRNCIIKFHRNNQYDLVATISGIIENKKELEPNSRKEKGTFVPDEIVTGYSLDGLYKYKFYGVFLGAMTISPISTTPFKAKFQADFIFHKVEKSLVDINANTASLQEWFLTGDSRICFPRITRRSVDKLIKKRRDGIDQEDQDISAKGSGNSKDYLAVKFADTSFIVAKVPTGFGPDWSFNISIEYRQSFGRIPNRNEREAISELVGFIFGNQLLKIGQSSYDSSLSLISQEFENPWGDNVVSRCQKIALPPVVISNYNDWGRVEIILNELIAPYLEHREQLKLNDVLWKYWIAKYSSLGTNLPILSSAVETLAGQVLKAHSEVKHYYIEYKEFCKMIQEELTSIEKKLEKNVHKESIINKIKGASQRGTNEKLKMMFEIIKLPIGKIEENAIKARNKMAHSSFGDISEDEIKETMRMTRAYETLFNRILLKILSYNGVYIDYYTFGHPNRKIDDPIQE